MPYSAQKKVTGRSALAGPVASVGRATSARMLSSSARPRRTRSSSAAARASASGGVSVSRRIGFSPHSSQRWGSTARKASAPPGVHDQRRLYAARASGANGVGTREASASAARSMSSRPSDTGAHDAITRRYGRRGHPARPAARGPPRGGCRGTRRASPSSRRRAISRSPSIRAGWSSGSAADQPGDAVADLQREVRRRRAHQLADVVDRDLVAGGLADRALGFAHGLLDCAWLVWAFLISRRESMRACVATEMARSSPTIQP